ncbi:MAG: PIN domain-containing protein [Campylobacteraceae bacterium]|nr:PIN domain-containing protein [Campylobacteraceae bacterium]
MYKVFLDTNIFISALDDTRKSHESAKNLIKNLYDDEKCIMLLSQDILTNIVYNSKNHRKEAVLMIKNMCDNPAFSIVSFSLDTILNACEYYLGKNNFSTKGEFEDALQYFCALENDCEKIYTDDKSSFPRLKISLCGSNGEEFYTA